MHCAYTYCSLLFMHQCAVVCTSHAFQPELCEIGGLTASLCCTLPKLNLLVYRIGYTGYLYIWIHPMYPGEAHLGYKPWLLTGDSVQHRQVVGQHQNQLLLRVKGLL